jgi:hypothetical protein
MALETLHMDKTTQNISAAALVILGIYTLIIGGMVSVPYHTQLVVGCFWTEIILIVAMLFRVQQSPGAVLPPVFATLCIIIPTAATVLSASANLVRHLLH